MDRFDKWVDFSVKFLGPSLRPLIERFTNGLALALLPSGSPPFGDPGPHKKLFADYGSLKGPHFSRSPSSPFQAVECAKS